MKEIDQTFACYICGKASAHARPWVMTFESQDEFYVRCGISVACPAHDREAIAQVLRKVEMKEGFTLSYFGIAEVEPIERAFEMATSLGESQAALYAEEE